MQRSTFPRILIVADDLTGAMDAAVPFTRGGFRVQVLPDSTCLTESFADADVLSVTTNTRHCTADESRRIITSMQPWLEKLQPELIIKKIDSTLRGNVVEETKALNDIVRKNHVVVCPAVPAQNRLVKDGQVLVEGRLLAETIFVSDIRSPAPRQSLKALFESLSPGWTIRSESPADPILAISSPEKRCLTICDAGQEEDILNIARRRLRVYQDTLFVGASGLTCAMAQVLCDTNRRRAVDDWKTGGPLLFLIGSMAPATEKQLATLIKAREITLFELKVEASPDDGRLITFDKTVKNQIFVIKAPHTSAHAAGLNPELVLSALAQSAVELAAGVHLSTIVVTGGDTAQALLSALDAKHVAVVGEIKQGVVFGRVTCIHGEYNLVTKAGAFGNADLFLDILEFFDNDS
jgi:uncharacterized protein YgbK (DUF1537 family)